MRKHWDIDIALMGIIFLMFFLWLTTAPNWPSGLVIGLALYGLIRRTKG